MTTTAERPNQFRLSPPTAVPCPDWCGDDLGHSYVSERQVDGAEMRSHSRTFGDSKAGADVMQDVVWWEGQESPDGPACIRVWIGGNSHESDITTPEQARRLAAALMEAADLLEQLGTQA